MLVHRGPDGQGVWQSRDASVCLGHRRLAIIDLSGNGAQPMISPDRSLAITFNGEIYNYQALRRELAGSWQFKSDSDTEVLLAGYERWGRDVVQHLVGMFAFALWDESKRELFLARDRAGEKPLYYATTPGGFAFASEIKALLLDPGMPRRLNWSVALQFLEYGYPLGADSFLEGINRLLPGHCAVVGQGECRVWRYWDLPAAAGRGAPNDHDELERRLEAMLAESVKDQMVADVPLGVLLSGGVDSSLITAMAAKAGGRVRTFTITFPENPEMDEAKPARFVAGHFGTNHVELEGRFGGPEVLFDLARQFDEPLGDSSQIPTYFVSKLARGHCTVVLGGDGGDELFGGYRHYNQLMGRTSVPAPLGDASAALAARILPYGWRGRNYIMNLAASACRPRLSRRLFDPVTLESLVGPERWHVARRATPEPEEERDRLSQALALDFRYYLPGDILTKVDRASMLASLEVRAPLLDHRLVEFAFRDVPPELKATASERKILLKRLARRILPAGFDLQRKQGFSVPMRQWLQGKWGTSMFSILQDVPADFLSQGQVDALVTGQQRGRRNGEVLFALTMLELWRREYRVSY